jgi:hypothetical protein
MVRPKLFTAQNFILLGLAGIFIVIIVVVIAAQVFGKKYQNEININTTPRELLPNSQTFDVKQIRLVDNTGCSSLIFNKNGEVSRVSCENVLENKVVVSNDEIQKLLRLINHGNFDQLTQHYYSDHLNITLIIETNYGTKEIHIDSSGDTPLPGDVGDIIDTAGDVGEQLNNPTPPPPPSTPPTPTPGPGSTPVPTPSPIPSGKPTPTPIPASPEPFDCSQITQKNVTISGIRCLGQ